MTLSDHPVLIKPTPEQLKVLVQKRGADFVAKFLQDREDKILAEKMDPYRHGYEPRHWNDADKLLSDFDEVCVMGGNRAGKTEWAAKKVMQILTSKPDARVWCLHTTSQSSIQMQQNVIWKYMPAELKTAKKTKITNISYSQKNGFSDNTFILPNKSQCFFMNYAQDKKVIEGGEVDFIWCDELVPLDWIETLRYRIVTRRGKMAVTFTPVQGYSQVVKDYVSGCKIKEQRRASLLDQTNRHVSGCEVGKMPYIAHSFRKNSACIWFHSDLNPYNPFDQLAKTLEGKNSSEIKIRAYGWAENTIGSQFPRFDDHNVIPADKVPEKGTDYMVVDPAGARNWFMIWARVDKNGNVYIFREFPDISMGEWALPSEKPDGKAGTAQRNGAGMGIDQYKELIRSLEDGTEPDRRFIDPRAGATQAVGRDGGTSLIELLDSGENPMFFEPAAGLRLEEGIAIINDWLSYDTSQPRSVVNQPRLYISEECQNLIYSMREWTGADGDKGASKDPVDCLRYLAVMAPEYNDTTSFTSNNKGFSY